MIGRDVYRLTFCVNILLILSSSISINKTNPAFLKPPFYSIDIQPTNLVSIRFKVFLKLVYFYHKYRVTEILPHCSEGSSQVICSGGGLSLVESTLGAL